MAGFLVFPDLSATPTSGSYVSGVYVDAPDAASAAMLYARSSTPAPGRGAPAGSAPVKVVIVLPVAGATKLRVGPAVWDKATPTTVVVSDQVA